MWFTQRVGVCMWGCGFECECRCRCRCEHWQHLVHIAKDGSFFVVKSFVVRIHDVKQEAAPTVVGLIFNRMLVRHRGLPPVGVVKTH